MWNYPADNLKERASAPQMKAALFIILLARALASAPNATTNVSIPTTNVSVPGNTTAASADQPNTTTMIVVVIAAVLGGLALLCWLRPVQAKRKEVRRPLLSGVHI